MKFGYWNGFLAGQRVERERYERENQRLVEQLADATFRANAQAQRADAAVDRLVQTLGLEAISSEARADRINATKVPSAGAHHSVPVTSPFEDLPLGHPEGSYTTFDEAALRAEDTRG